MVTDPKEQEPSNREIWSTVTFFDGGFSRFFVRFFGGLSDSLVLRSERISLRGHEHLLWLETIQYAGGWMCGGGLRWWGWKERCRLWGENEQNKPLRKLRQNLVVGKLSLLFRCYSCVTKRRKKLLLRLSSPIYYKKVYIDRRQTKVLSTLHNL